MARLTYDQLFKMSEAKRITRSHDVSGPPMDIDSYRDAVYYCFNFKSRLTNTTGLRHRGYVKFFRPRSRKAVPLQKLECLVDCECFAGDTPVLMADGTYKPISLIGPGDYVYTHKGRIRPVIGNMSRALKPGEKVYSVKVAGFPTPLTVTEGHPFFTWRGTDEQAPEAYLSAYDAAVFEQVKVGHFRDQEWFWSPALEEDQGGCLKRLESRELSNYSGLVWDLCVDEDESFIVAEVAVHNCPDFRYRWAWSNKQRGSSMVGAQSLNQALNRAPRRTNPGNVPGLCVAKGELVSTDRGLIPIEDVTTSDKVWTLEGWRQVTAAGMTGHKPVLVVTLKSGRKMRLTAEHPVYAFNAETGFDWIEAGNLTKKHHACITLPEDIAVELGSVFVPEFRANARHYPACTLRLDETFAEVTGYMVAEGSPGFFAAQLPQIAEDFSSKWRQLFGPNSVTVRPSGCNIGAHGSRILASTGFKFGSFNKVVPPWIFTSRRSIVLAFLRGCYAGDGNFRAKHSTYASVSESLARGIHLLLDLVGVRASIKAYVMGVKKTLTWLVRTSSAQETDKLFHLLNPLRGWSASCPGFGTAGRFNNILSNPTHLFRRTVEAHLPESDDQRVVCVQEVRAFVDGCAKVSPDDTARLLRQAGLLTQTRLRAGGKPHNQAKVCDIYAVLRGYRARKIVASLDLPRSDPAWKMHRMVVRDAVHKLREQQPQAAQVLATLVRDDVTFDQVVSVQPDDCADVYDLTVESASHFTVGGAVVHNCKHILATADYIYGLVSSFPSDRPDTSEKFDKLLRHATKRWDDFEGAMATAREKQGRFRRRMQVRNIQGPLGPEPAPEPGVQNVVDPEPEGPPLPPELPDEYELPVPGEEPVEQEQEPAAPAMPTTPGQELPRVKGKVDPGGFPTVAQRRAARYGESENVVNANSGRKMKELLESLKLVEQIQDEMTDLGAPPDGMGSSDSLASAEFAPDLPPSEPPVSDSAIGADTEGETALDLLRQMRDSLEQLSTALAPPAPEGEAPEGMPGESGAALPPPGEGAGDAPEGLPDLDDVMPDPDAEEGEEGEEGAPKGEEDDEGEDEEDEDNSRPV